MVSITDVRASNESLKSQPPGLVAVFAGATAGIGLHTLKQLARHANAPRVYLIGRSRAKVATLLVELKALNPEGSYIFIEGEFSLVQDVDTFSEEIKKAEERVDILCMSPGYLSFAGREDQRGTGSLPRRPILQPYPPHNQSPSPSHRQSLPRIISILAAGEEGPIDTSDLEVRTNYSFKRTSSAAPTMTTLAFEELSKQFPTVSFIHSFPGQVNTEILPKALKTVPGIWHYPAQLLRITLLGPMLRIFCMSGQEAGERALFLATSARYPAAIVDEKGGKTPGFVPVSPAIGLAQSTIASDGRGNGVYRTTDKGEIYPEKQILVKYRDEGVGKVVLEHTMTLCERARGTITQN